MASTTVAFAILTLVFLPSVPSDAADCGPTLILLAPCMPFAQGAEAAPPGQCCNNLANVIREQPDCVCPILNRSISLPVNRSLVLELPSLCRINVTADADSCHGLLCFVQHEFWNFSVSPAVESPQPSLRMNNFLLGRNWGGKLRVEGTSAAFTAIILILGTL